MHRFSITSACNVYGTNWNNIKAWFALAIVACFVITSPVATADSVENARVAKIKSAYLLNFIRFTEWPKRSFASPDSAIQICLLGRDSLGTVLDSTVQGQAVSGRSIAVVRLETDSRDLDTSTLERLRRCHLVFIGDSEASRLGGILIQLSDADILTVGESGSFAADGTMLALNLERDRVVFYANPGAIRAGNISLSSKILQLARIVDGRNSNGGN